MDRIATMKEFLKDGLGVMALFFILYTLLFFGGAL
tara:strand:- start:126 stop:230 length:105 start_codon:yes stop_codon:yes gene_type:complete